MSLDCSRGSLVGDAFDNIRIQRSLQQIFTGCTHIFFQSISFFLKDINKGLSNDFPFPFGIGNTLEQSQESLGCIDTTQINATIFPHSFQYTGCFVLAQTSIVHHDGMESISNRTRHQHGSHRGIHASTDGTQNVSFRADHEFDLFHKVVRVLRHDPILWCLGYVYHKVLDEGSSEGRVGNLRMKLNAPNALLGVLHRDEFRIFRLGHRYKVLWQCF
mmetsp:Transcript_33778/g.51819  ORF Transcript_33778/g.51819 Transcript_33778/m.51819 type:complete len:217 (-) Transcript_33778:385-1035(-)